MDAWDAVGLLVLLRLWRVVRIVNGMFNFSFNEIGLKLAMFSIDIFVLFKELFYL